MYHTIHAADVHEHTVGSHGLHGAGVVLADLDVVPDLRLGGLTGLIGHGLDGADDAAAGTVDLGDPQGHGLADHGAQLSAAGQTGLGSGHKHAHALDINDDTALVLLGVKDRSMNPWDKFMATYHVGDVANVRIVKLMTFGAFAEVVPGVDGLIHISQIADRRIEKPGDVLTEGEMVDAKITAIDEEKQKISLSIRALLAPAADEDADEE